MTGKESPMLKKSMIFFLKIHAVIALILWILNTVVFLDEGQLLTLKQHFYILLGLYNALGIGVAFFFIAISFSKD
jgi:hypothetical protein